METEANKIIKQPSYRFAGYTEPWEEKKLGEVAEVNPKSVVPDEFKYVDLGAVVGTEMVSYRNETISTSPSRAQRLAIKGDIFYQTVRPYQKNNYLFEKDDNDYVFSTGYAQLRPSGDGCFLLSYLQTNKFVNVVLDNCTGTSYPAINSKDLSDIFISLPTLSEQTAIGSFFQDIDQLISLQQRKLEVLKEQKKTYLKLLFPEKGQTKPALRFAGFEDDWKEVKLGEIADILGGNAWKSNTYSEKGRYLIITISNVKGDEYIDDSYGNRIDTNDMKFVLSKDDILISMTGNVGRVSKMTAEDAVLNQRVAKIVTTSDSEFIYTVLSDSKFENQMILSSQGAAQANISNKDILSYKLLLPTLEEQTIIGNLFRNLDDSITQHQTKLNRIKEIKQTFLKKMFI